MGKRSYEEYYNADMMAMECENIPPTSSSTWPIASPPTHRRKLFHNTPLVQQIQPIFFNQPSQSYNAQPVAYFDSNSMDERSDESNSPIYVSQKQEKIFQQHSNYSHAHMQHVEHIKQNILNNTTNACYASPSQRVENFIDVIVKNINGEAYDIMIDHNNTTIHDLKEIIFRRSRLPVDKQRIVHHGRALADSLNLRDTTIKQGSILHLVMALRGG